MLTEVGLTNFKSVRDLKLPLGALTILAGKNGSGKSTLLQSFAALRQSYLFGTGRGLLLTGPLASLGSSRDVLSEGAREETIEIVLRASASEWRWCCDAQPDTDELAFTAKPESPYDALISPTFQYLQADRIVPRTLYPQADHRSRSAGFLGSRGEYTPDFLARQAELAVSKRRHFPKMGSELPEALLSVFAATSRLGDQVAGWLQRISPGVHLSAQQVPGTDEVALKYQYFGVERGRSNSYRPTHVGFGLTYSLPIVVAALSAPAGSLLLIENPEAHLHPSGQVWIGALLALCAADGVQLLVETHSDHLLNGVRLAVKRGDVSSDLTRFCYFVRDLNTGDSFTQVPSLLPDGQMSNWPDGFFDEWTKSLDALLE
jgi:predicted ATPase